MSEDKSLKIGQQIDVWNSVQLFQVFMHKT